MGAGEHAGRAWRAVGDPAVPGQSLNPCKDSVVSSLLFAATAQPSKTRLGLSSRRAVSVPMTQSGGAAWSSLLLHTTDSDTDPDRLWQPGVCSNYPLAPAKDSDGP